MRRGQQPRMHRTPHTTHDTHSNPRQHAHAHTQSCRNTNTQMEEGEENRSGTQGSTACTHGESGPSCRHPSRRVRTHTRGGAAHTATQSKVTMKRNDPRTPRGLLVHGKCSQYLSQKQFSCLRPSFIFSAHHFMQAQPPPQQPHAQKYKRKKWNNARNHLFLFRFGYYEMSACLVLFFQRATLHAWAVCWGFLQGAQLFFFPLVNVSCVGAANNSVFVVPASLW
ncbi:hypothetical protein TCDM_09191 [Trypanosoma cruzi Dm28c]|uniref:Uncharacterized protein n=1 Tax=Trypanosoma cruzi Dm28c TaxID=1416333 RepID=V5BAL7_TRYCR|nr:hypothetical protein TCDM_09191 [Trypanosoma cruzi Dm28c]